MKLKAFAEIVLDWQRTEYNLVEYEKVRDSILGVRATLIEQSIDKRGSLPRGVRQTLKLNFSDIDDEWQSDIVPRRLLKATSPILTTKAFKGKAKHIDIVTELNANLSFYKRLTADAVRAYEKDSRYFLINATFPYLNLSDIFQNPLEVEAINGNDPDDWEIEESLFGVIKPFFVNPVKQNDGGEIGITENNVQGVPQNV